MGLVEMTGTESVAALEEGSAKHQRPRLLWSRPDAAIADACLRAGTLDRAVTRTGFEADAHTLVTAPVHARAKRARPKCSPVRPRHPLTIGTARARLAARADVLRRCATDGILRRREAISTALASRRRRASRRRCNHRGRRGRPYPTSSRRYRSPPRTSPDDSDRPNRQCRWVRSGCCTARYPDRRSRRRGSHRPECTGPPRRRGIDLPRTGNCRSTCSRRPDTRFRLDPGPVRTSRLRGYSASRDRR